MWCRCSFLVFLGVGASHETRGSDEPLGFEVVEHDPDVGDQRGIEVFHFGGVVWLVGVCAEGNVFLIIDNCDPVFWQLPKNDSYHRVRDIDKGSV